MNRWVGKVAVVTGASAGIGVAISEHLVNSGITVVGLARRKERMEQLIKNLQGKAGKFYAVKADVSKESELLQAFNWIKDNVGPIHILINNAGILRPKGLLDGETKHWKEILETNVIGLCVATKEAVKIMKANNIDDGHIIHINSIAGHSIPDFPNINVYAASKHAVTALTETLRKELNFLGSKIKITSISPGYVESEIVQASGVEMSSETANVMKTAPILKAKDIAEAVYYVLSTPPHVQVHELIIKPVGEKF